MHVLDKSGRKHFSFQHVSMVLDIFIIVLFQVLADFKRTHLPPLPDPNCEDEYTEVENSNKEPASSSGKSKIHIVWDIIHRFVSQHSCLALSGRLILG